jgi:hypothetical protein
MLLKTLLATSILRIVFLKCRRSFFQSTIIIQATFLDLSSSFMLNFETIDDQNFFSIAAISLMTTVSVSSINFNRAIDHATEFSTINDIFLTDDASTTLISSFLREKLLETINSRKKRKRKRISFKINEIEEEKDISNVELQHKLNHLTC